jgi:Na+-driven multidrug efflux pump
MVYIGTSAAGAALAGNAIGAGDAPKARRTVVVLVVFNLLTWSVTAALMIFAPLPRLLLRHQQCASGSQSFDSHYYAVAGLFDSSQVLFGGWTRGMGRPTTAAIICVSSYYFCKLPMR